MLTAIKAFFAGFSTYFYGAITVIVISGLVWYTVHERHIGEAKIEARDVIITTQRTKIADAAIQHNKDVEDLAQLNSEIIGLKYAQAVAAAVVNPPRLMCIRPRPAASGSQVPSAAGNQSSDPGAADERAEAPVDLGPAIVTVGKDADAQINALIDEVQVLTDAMNGKTQ